MQKNKNGEQFETTNNNTKNLNSWLSMEYRFHRWSKGGFTH